MMGVLSNVFCYVVANVGIIITTRCQYKYLVMSCLVRLC